MAAVQTSDRALGYVWKVAVVAVAYHVGTVVSGALMTSLGMQFPELADYSNQYVGHLLNVIGSILLAVCLALVARGIGGSPATRWLILAVFAYVSYGLNNQLEAAIFTTLGGTGTMILFFILPCALGAAAAVLLFAAPAEAARRTITDRPLRTWWWRLVLAWLAFPVIYYLFGMLAGPFVVEAYQSGDLPLVLPSQAVIIRTVLIRSLLFLVVSAPVLFAWRRSRRSLILALGLSFFMMTGFIGLVTVPGLFPTTVRIAHSVEVLFDSMVYAWVLVALLFPKEKQVQGELASATGS